MAKERRLKEVSGGKAALRYANCRRLSPSQEADVDELIERCARFDGTVETLNIARNWEITWNDEIPLFYTASYRRTLAGVLSLFIPTGSEAELSVFVHPNWRRKGICSELCRRASSVLLDYGIRSLLIVANEKSQAAKEVISRRKAAYLYTEYSMEYIGPASEGGGEVTAVAGEEEDFEKLVSLNMRVFSEPEAHARIIVGKSLSSARRTPYMLRYGGEVIGIGTLSHHAEHRTIGLYGYGLLPQYRGRGLAKAALKSLIREARAVSSCPIGLEVDSTNSPAYDLYRSVGFTAVTAYEYYRLELTSSAEEDQ